VPVLGNGDILTLWDHAERRRTTAVSGVVVARGALIKPWIFRELLQDEAWYPTVAERWAVMRRYADFALEYFGDDEKGTRRAERFFLWHAGFWHRYHPWTEQDWQHQHPDSLLQARNPDPGEDPELRLLASAEEADHAALWQRVLHRDFPGA
jgi:tRNA-dihydrouridine synthase 3